MIAERPHLVIGANGLVGRAIASVLSRKNIPWRGTHYQRPEKNLAFLDITNPHKATIATRKKRKIMFFCFMEILLIYYAHS